MVTSAGLSSISQAANVFNPSRRKLCRIGLRDVQNGGWSLRSTKSYVILVGRSRLIRFSKAPLIGPEGRDTHKMFIFDGNPQQAALWEAAGFNVVPLSGSEITTGLQTGLITAVPATAQTALLFQWYQNAPNMMSYAWAPLMGAIIVKKDVWLRIEPGLRHLLKETAKTSRGGYAQGDSAWGRQSHRR